MDVLVMLCDYDGNIITCVRPYGMIPRVLLGDDGRVRPVTYEIEDEYLCHNWFKYAGLGEAVARQWEVIVRFVEEILSAPLVRRTVGPCDVMYLRVVEQRYMGFVNVLDLIKDRLE
jgi:hypothetical protein